MDKGKMYTALAIMISQKVITWDDLKGFREEGLERVKRMLTW